MSRLTRAAVCALSIVLVPAVHAAPVYHLVDLGSGTLVHAINKSDTVVGEKIDARARAALFRNGGWHKLDAGTEALAIDNSGNIVGDIASDGTALFWARGEQSVPITVPGSGHTLVYGINDGRTAVGAAEDTFGNEHCYRWTPSAGGSLMTPDMPNCTATAINANGWVTGGAQFSTTTFAPDAFLWHDGHYQDLGNFGGSGGSMGNAINAAGHVVGNASLPTVGYSHGFFYDGQQMHDLGTFGGWLSTAEGINAKDEIVGTSTLPDFTNLAYLYTGGVMLDLNTLVDNLDGWQLWTATAINDKGTIIGRAIVPGTIDQHSFMAVRVSD